MTVLTDHDIYRAKVIFDRIVADAEGQAAAIVRGVAEALAEEREAARSKWRPFEGAPTDGTSILVYRPDAGVFVAAFVAYGTEGEKCWWADGGEDLSDDLPTHWMPLPAPPESTP